MFFSFTRSKKVSVSSSSSATMFLHKKDGGSTSALSPLVAETTDKRLLCHDLFETPNRSSHQNFVHVCRFLQFFFFDNSKMDIKTCCGKCVTGTNRAVCICASACPSGSSSLWPQDAPSSASNLWPIRSKRSGCWRSVRRRVSSTAKR